MMATTLTLTDRERAALLRMIEAITGDLGIVDAEGDDAEDLAHLEAIAARIVGAAPEFARFSVDSGAPISAAELVDANPDDAELADWTRSARIGDRFPAFVDCVRVA